MSPVFPLASAAALAFFSTVVGVLSAVLSVSSLVRAPRRIIPVSGVLLMAIALAGVLPELAGSYGWTGGPALLAAGVAALWAVNRYVYPVCPSCSHTHDHDHCAAALHGFAAPLVAAASLHSFLDGLGIAASRQEPAEALAAVVVLGVALHKIPEGIALGVMFRAALRSRVAALAWCVAIESATLAGALLEAAITGRLGVEWVSYALALAGGSFLYLGFHAVHGTWKRRAAAAHRPAPAGRLDTL